MKANSFHFCLMTHVNNVGQNMCRKVFRLKNIFIARPDVKISSVRRKKTENILRKRWEKATKKSVYYSCSMRMPFHVQFLKYVLIRLTKCYKPLDIAIDDIATALTFLGFEASMRSSVANIYFSLWLLSFLSPVNRTDIYFRSCTIHVDLLRWRMIKIEWVVPTTIIHFAINTDVDIFMNSPKSVFTSHYANALSQCFTNRVNVNADDLHCFWVFLLHTMLFPLSCLVLFEHSLWRSLVWPRFCTLSFYGEHFSIIFLQSQLFQEMNESFEQYFCFSVSLELCLWIVDFFRFLLYFFFHARCIFSHFMYF